MTHLPDPVSHRVWVIGIAAETERTKVDGYWLTAIHSQDKDA